MPLITCNSRNLPVYIKQIGCKKIRVDAKVRKEVSLMKNARHPNLIEFVGLILEPQRAFIVEGMKLKSLKIFSTKKIKNQNRILCKGVIIRCTCKSRH